MSLSRRAFLKGAVVTGIAASIAASGLDRKVLAATTAKVGTVIDLTKCDGCQDRQVPACVEACRQVNQHRFPEPVENIQPYWPQAKYEDWSKKRDITDRLTPYNWTFVQKVSVEHQGRQVTVYIPRRCMHCDNPPCANLCPFGAQEKTPEGPVRIDPQICFGGAKCRDVCPWHIPQRQAGVGTYLKVAPKLAGGGVMYKCDLCYDRIRTGGMPACVEACPRQAIIFGRREEMRQAARTRASEISGYIYGEKENGGTSTFYVSAVPFEKIHQGLMDGKQSPGLPVGVDNYLDTANGLAWGLAVAPIAGVVTGAVAAYRTLKGED